MRLELLLQDGRVQAHGVPVAPVAGQRPGLAETLAAHRAPERLFLDVYVPARDAKKKNKKTRRVIKLLSRGPEIHHTAGGRKKPV